MRVRPASTIATSRHDRNSGIRELNLTTFINLTRSLRVPLLKDITAAPLSRPLFEYPAARFCHPSIRHIATRLGCQLRVSEPLHFIVCWRTPLHHSAHATFGGEWGKSFWEITPKRSRQDRAQFTVRKFRCLKESERQPRQVSGKTPPTWLQQVAATSGWS